MTDQRKVRLDDLKFWFDSFREEYGENFGHPLAFIPSAPEIIHEYYWNLIEEKVRPYLRHLTLQSRVDRHKIISAMEMCIMFGLPIEHPDQDERRKLNAHLAFFVGKQILLTFHHGRLDVRGPANFNSQHLALLQMVNLEGFPVFSNAATWYLFELLCPKIP
ncbi:MAG: hypothetical protein JRI97_12225 [Deltaproteobacteria bacterium]|nr:hypothetical protein [Deltaproteobacteria bacterium]